MLHNFIRAEAERMRMKASAYKQYGDAAILSLVLEALPQIAAEVSIKPSLNKANGVHSRCLLPLPRQTRLC